MNAFDRLNIFLFAAGLGTRLRPATLNYPKPVLPLLGIPLGYYLLPYFKNLNYEKIIVNTFHLPEHVHMCYQKLSLSIHFSDETDFIKGSAGGLKQAETLLKSQKSFLAANADEVLFTKNANFLNEAFNQHTKNKALATLIVTEHPEAGYKFGAIWTVSSTDQQVIHIGKNPPPKEKYPHAKPWHYIGLQFLATQVLDFIPDVQERNIFYDVLIHQLTSQRVEIMPIETDWYEVGNLEDYKIAKKIILEKLPTHSYYQSHLQELKKFPASQLSDLA